MTIQEAIKSKKPIRRSVFSMGSFYRIKKGIDGEATYFDGNGKPLLPNLPGVVHPLLEDILATDWEIEQ